VRQSPLQPACETWTDFVPSLRALVESAKSGSGMNGGMNTIDLSGSLGLSVKRRYSDIDDTPRQQSHPIETAAVLNGGPLLADVNADPYALKSGRVKACADCRKSKVSSICHFSSETNRLLASLHT
jgi:hypothetical protein